MLKGDHCCQYRRAHVDNISLRKGRASASGVKLERQRRDKYLRTYCMWPPAVVRVQQVYNKPNNPSLTQWSDSQNIVEENTRGRLLHWKEGS